MKHNLRPSAGTLERLASFVNGVLRARGYELRRYDYGNTAYQAQKALMDKRIDTVVDVGANRGQYGGMIVRNRPDVAIRSFEPLPDAFKDLEALTKSHMNWTAYNVALGRSRAVKPLTIAGNSESSSLLEMNALHVEAAPTSAPIGRVEVPVKTLDDYFNILGKDLFLKVDTQGFEAEVIAGASKVLEKTRYVQLEISFASLYEGAPRPDALIRQMRDSGFEVHTLNPVFSDRQRERLLQADILFSRLI